MLPCILPRFSLSPPRGGLVCSSRPNEPVATCERANSAMFFSNFIFNKKGPLGKVWLAAHWDTKMTKTMVLQTDVSQSAGKVADGPLSRR